VELVEMPWLDGYGSRARHRALASGPGLAIWARTLMAPGNAGPYLRHARTYGDILAQNLLKARDLDRFLQRRGLREAIGYDYWFENSTLALALVRRRGGLRLAVSRGHRFDLYDDLWAEGRVPFREEKARGLDHLFAVSRVGEQYLRERLPDDGLSTSTAYLGVARTAPPPPPSHQAPDSPATVLTCASLLPHKRVHLVPHALSLLDRPLRWVHLGDGPERPRVEAEARRLLGPSVRWSMPGHVDNADVHRFYREERVDAFLSLSVSEGLPVTMMEAISHGVPVVAAGVQGVPELVNETTGVLLAPDATPADAAAGLTRALEPGRFDPGRIHAYFLDHFEADANYNAFADGLVALWKAEAPPG
jgi:glycosyltransferase involved in cell wall biosynthesis